MHIAWILGLIFLLVGTFYLVAGPPNRVVTPDTTEPIVSTNDTLAETSTTAPSVPAVEVSDPSVESLVPEPMMEFPIPDADFDFDSRTVEITATDSGFDITEIQAEVGETLTINLVVREGYHNWVLEGYDLETEGVRAGGLATITFTVDQPGSFSFYSSTTNNQTSDLNGVLIVR